MMQEKRQWTKAEWVALAAILVNLLLTLVKFVLAYLSGSLSLKVEAFHSFADIGSSMMIWLAIRTECIHKENQDIVTQDNHDKHPIPFLRRFLTQQKVSLMIGFLLLVVGLVFLNKVRSPDPLVVNYPAIVALVMLIMALASFLLARFERITGEKEQCTALVADSFHARVDMLGSFLVAIALFCEALGFTIDRWAALILAVFVLFQSVNVFGAVIKARSMQDGEQHAAYHYWFWGFIPRVFHTFAHLIEEFLLKCSGKESLSAKTKIRIKRFVIVSIVIIASVGYLGSGFFIVEAGYEAIIERLGKPIDPDRPLQPGLHYGLPWPFEQEQKVSVAKIRRLNIGSTVNPEQRIILWTNRHYEKDFNVLTGENIFIDVGVIIHYRINNVAYWLYQNKDSQALLSSIAKSVLTEVLSTQPFLESITSQRQKLEELLFKALIKEIQQYKTGIEIISFHIRDIHPPTYVASDFEAVVSAMIEYETALNEAKNYTETLIPEARGKAKVTLLAAQAEKQTAIRKAHGNTARLVAEQSIYRKHPKITKMRLQLESNENILSGRRKIIIPADITEDVLELILSPQEPLPNRKR